MRFASTMFGVVLLCGTNALAAPESATPSASDKAAAETLFVEARKLLDAGKVAEACPKLAASQKLDPALGTLLNLARCYRETGRTASAWASFLEAAQVAKSSGQAERERAARNEAAALESKLTRLTVMVAPEPADVDVVVKRDATALPAGAWGVATPIDPGEHVVSATAAGKKTWQQRVTIEGGKDLTLSVPVLEDLPLQSDKPEASGSGSQESKTHGMVDVKAERDPRPPLATWVLGGVGVAGLAVATVWGFQAMSKNSDVEQACPQGGCSYAQYSGAMRAHDDAKNAETIAVVGAAVGAGALAAAGIVWWRHAKHTPTPGEVAVLPELGVSAGGFVVKGAW